MPSQDKKTEKTAAAFTTGFPHLERLVEQDDFTQLNKTFLAAYEQLETITKGKADAQRKKSAQKAMRALELTMNLLRDFLKVKEDLLKQGLSPNKK